MGYRMDIVEYSTGSYLILVYFEIMTLILELIFSNNNSIIVISQDIATWNVWMMGLGQHGAFFREWTQTYMGRLNGYVIYDLLTNYWILWVSNIGFPEAMGAPKFDGRPGVSHGVFRHSKTAPNCVPKPCSNLFTSGGSKLQASRFQNGPLATAKQHLIACRNRVQTYPEKLPNVPSEFLEKMSLFSASCSCCLVAPSCKHIRPPERTLRHSAGLNLPAKTPSRPFSIPRQVSLFYLLQLLFGGSKLQASGLQNGPFATAKQHLIACRNVVQAYPQKLPNVPSEFQEKMSFVCLLQLLFGGSKLQAWSL